MTAQLPDPEEYEWGFETRDGVGIWNIRGWDGFADETLRLMTRTSVGGRGVRLRFANTFGSEPLTLDEVSVGIRDGGAAVERGTLRSVTFGGDTSITIPEGGRVLSDPVSLSVEPEQDLATSVYISEPTGPTTWHALPTKTSYTSERENLTGTAAGDSFTEEFTHWFFLEGVEVVSPDDRRERRVPGYSRRARKRPGESP